MIKKEINGKEYLFVTVPEGTSFGRVRDKIPYWIDIYGSYGGNTIALPEGNYTIIGKGDSLSEEQWKGIIPGGVYNEKFCGYESYACGNVYYPTATESGLSLIKSIGMKPENCLVIIKNNLL